MRHKQMEIDRQMGLESYKGIRVYSLPRVGRNDCHYRIEVKP